MRFEKNRKITIDRPDYSAFPVNTYEIVLFSAKVLLVHYCCHEMKCTACISDVTLITHKMLRFCTQYVDKLFFEFSATISDYFIWFYTRKCFLIFSAGWTEQKIIWPEFRNKICLLSWSNLISLFLKCHTRTTWIKSVSCRN